MVKMAVYCTKCHSENPDDSSFCSKCGSQLIGVEEKPAFTKTIHKSIQELTSGTFLADQYEIIEELGRGGMGVVYRAKDRKLGREVAIKVLPQEFSQDWERLARFEREAKLLASLNHPKIAAIYGLEESEGINFLVLELAEGKTLAERVVTQSLETEETLKICHQIAEALEAAHEKGIIHRDLKPANIKVTPEGKVKVLDFGLAKAFETAVSGEAPSVDLSKSPTITVESSRSGVILGMAAYMSPEQARGRPLDKRTDIWSFGCILFEVLTGQKAFKGDTISDSIAAILKSEPDWKAVPETTPLKLRDLLRRCLQKDPHNRLHDIADARIDIQDILTGLPAEEVTTLRPAPKWRTLFWVIVGMFLIVACVLLWKILSSPQAIPGQVQHLMVNLPESALLAPAATSPLGVGRPTLTLSPDGSRLVYVAINGDRTQLYLRRMDQDEIEPIPGTEGAHSPFFSPDGKWIVFVSERSGIDHLYRKLADGSGEAEQITFNEPCLGSPYSFSPDGNLISYSCRTTQLSDLWIYTMKNGKGHQPFLQTPFSEGFSTFSPDGRWIAYTSDESGRWEIYVQPYYGPGGK